MSMTSRPLRMAKRSHTGSMTWFIRRASSTWESIMRLLSLQQFANEEQLSITVLQYPPGTSKWNKIEHQVFSFISMNWRAKPLTSLEVVLDLLNHTTTEEGLTVTAIKDSHTYPTGIEVTNDEMKALHLIRHSFHGEWNYTIKPQPT